MQSDRNRFGLGLAAFGLLFGTTEPAFAYLDPGTGSMVLQMIIAGAVTAAASIRIFWSQIKDYGRRIFGSGKEQHPPPPQREDQA